MNNSAAKVGEIFTEAGAAFNKLAEMCMMLHPMAEQLPMSTPSKTPVKRKLADEKTGSTGVSLSSAIVTPNISQSQQITPTGPISQQVTLNMLNAQENEMDVGLESDVKLEFECSTEEVTT